MEYEKTNTDVKQTFFDNVRSTVTSKGAGFFVGAATFLLAVVLSVLYASFYGGTEYYDPASLWVMISGGILFVLLSLTSYTSKYAPIPLLIGVFVGFLMFVNSIYIYFADVFYGGVNAEAIAAFDKRMLTCIILFVVVIVAANVSLYMKQNVDRKHGAEERSEGDKNE